MKLIGNVGSTRESVYAPLPKATYRTPPRSGAFPVEELSPARHRGNPMPGEAWNEGCERCFALGGPRSAFLDARIFGTASDGCKLMRFEILADHVIGDCRRIGARRTPKRPRGIP